MQIPRRDVLKFAVSAGVAWAASPLLRAGETPAPILDGHIHLFNPQRPGGVPWPYPTDTAIYKPSLPDRYARIAMPLGVVGAIAIEASPLATDNDWVLGVAAKNPIIVGMVGDLVPGSPDYLRELERLHRNSLFLGIRYGNLWNRKLLTDSKKPGFIAGLQQLHAYGLAFESANPDAELIRALVYVSDKIPELRIVIDHLPSAPIPQAGAARDEYRSNLRHLSQNPNVFVKLSEIPVRVGQEVRLDLPYYRAHLDEIWDVFGENHLLFGSDWPNSDHLASYADTLRLVRSYIAGKGAAASRKFFWENSKAAYRWRPRRPDQSVG